MCLISTYIGFMVIFAQSTNVTLKISEYEEEVINAPDRQMQGYGAYRKGTRRACRIRLGGSF